MGIIPKCKECEFYKYSTDNQGYGKKHHWCTNVKAPENKYLDQVLIYAKDIKTSPQWCPKRLS